MCVFFLFNWFKCIHWFTHTRCTLRSRARKFVLGFILMPNNNFNKFKFITDARTESKQCKNAYKIWWMNWLGRDCVKCIKWMQQQQEDTHEKKKQPKKDDHVMDWRFSIEFFPHIQKTGCISECTNSARKNSLSSSLFLAYIFLDWKWCSKPFKKIP